MNNGKSWIDMKTPRVLSLALLISAAILGCSENNSSVSNRVDSVAPVIEPEPEIVKKVLLIGVDGLMYSYIDAVDDPVLNEPETPNFDRLTIVPALTGGYFQTSSLQATSSGPGWASILSGTWVDRHDVASNNLQPLAVPALFALLDKRDPTIDSGSFAVWLALNLAHFIQEMPLVERPVSTLDQTDLTLSVDDFMSKEVIDELDTPESSLGFVFVHLDEMDAAGHNCGWCTPYEDELLRTDERLGQILDAVERRERDLNEQWLVILTSDHGHVQPGGHGGNTVIERTSLIGVNRPELMNSFFHHGSPPVELTEDGGQNALMGQPAVVSIVPTVLDYLGYPTLLEDKFAGASLMSELGVYRLIATVAPQTDFSTAQVRLDWLNGDRVQQIRVYRDNVIVAQLSAEKTSYTETITLSDYGAGRHIYEYSVEANIGTPLTSQATVTLGEQPDRTSVEQDALLQLAFDASVLPLGWVPGESPEPQFAAGYNDDDRSLILNRKYGYASWIKSLADTPKFSLGLRVRIRGAVDSDPNLVSNKDWSGGANPGFTLAVTDDGLRLNIGDGLLREDTAALSYSKERWLYVAAVVDLDNKLMSIYVSDPIFGFSKDTRSTGGVTSLGSEYPVNLGEGGEGSYNVGRHLEADVSEFIVFDRALSELEVRALAEPLP